MITKNRIKIVLTLAVVLGVFAAFGGSLQAAMLIYEPFDYTPGALGGASDGAGFGGAWIVTSNGSYPLIEVKDGGLSFTDAYSNILDVSGNSVYRAGSGGRSEANRVISPVSQATLLADGSTIWFSVLYQKTAANGRAAFVIGTDTYDVAAGGNLYNFTAGGEGFGFGSSDDNLITALAYDDSAGLTEVDSTVVASAVKLIVGKIVWNPNGTADELYLYDVTDLTTEPTTPIATVTADLDQSAFDLVVLQHSYNNTTFDEVRIGTKYNNVIGPMNPSPYDGETVSAANPLELSWTNLAPWDPNDSVWVDVYFDTVSPPVAQYVFAEENRTSLLVDASTIGETYYWQVDSYLDGSPTGDPNVGDVWVFYAADLPPSVDAGDDMITWSGEPVELDATIEDDGHSTLTYVFWSAEPADGVVFDPGADVEDPIVTITKVVGVPIIVNGGFEDPVLADGDWTEGINGTPGWSQSQQGTIAALVTDSTVYFGAGVLNPDTATYGYEAPVGANIGYMESANNPNYTCLKQMIPATLQAGWTYELSALVGNPQAYNVSQFNPDGVAPDYEIALVAGGVIVESSFGAAPADPNLPLWKTASLSFAPEADHAQLGGQLEIWLIGYPLNDEILDPVNGSNSGGYMLNFDDVQLTADGPVSTDASTVTLTLVAADAVNPPVEDTMEIDVYDNNCLAAKGAGLAAIDTADIDANCITDIEDFAEMALTWLVDYVLTEPVEKP